MRKTRNEEDPKYRERRIESENRKTTEKPIPVAWVIETERAGELDR